MADEKCEHCTTGYLAKGKPKGKEEQIAGVPAYWAHPKGESKSAVVYITDAFGHTFDNNRILADSIAEHAGVVVVMPDVFEGQPLSHDVMSLPQEKRMAAFGPFMARNGNDVRVPLVRNFIQELREKHGFTKIGTVGYCFGGRISTLMAANEQTVANVICHPATLNIPQEIEAIKNPTLWICAETDQTFPVPAQKQTEEILQKRGIPTVFKFYPGTVHGFAVRGDESEPQVFKAKVDALEQTVNFFRKHLA